MSTHRPTLFVALASTTAAVLALGAAPAFAADSGTTPVRLTVLRGSLSITVPDTIQLADATDSVEGTSVFGRALTAVTVTDTRGKSVATDAAGAWIARAQSSAFTGPQGATIAANLVGYDAGELTVKGLASSFFSSTAQTDISSALTAVQAVGGALNNSASWFPKITLTVPAGTTPGAYAGTLTHSVA